jgi:hypothetical protein
MANDVELMMDWAKLRDALKETIGKRPSDLNAVIFLIGVQELGKGPIPFTKEQKQDLMHIATCRLLAMMGHYELEGHDAEGWPHWKLIKPLPHFELFAQESLLKTLAVRYFREEIGWDF